MSLNPCQGICATVAVGCFQMVLMDRRISPERSAFENPSLPELGVCLSPDGARATLPSVPNSRADHSILAEARASDTKVGQQL